MKDTHEVDHHDQVGVESLEGVQHGAHQRLEISHRPRHTHTDTYSESLCLRH